MEINLKIQKLRNEMHKLIAEKKNNLDPEVIKASQMLDQVLNQYYEEQPRN
ncbi:aspartyl-phosphate phosphatase Spo0E family protein [Lutibacter sp. B2]|nr:aspartyl-phosphate phosphatase Spo0E family protein [Lutibacter sp. B2]